MPRKCWAAHLSLNVCEGHNWLWYTSRCASGWRADTQLLQRHNSRAQVNSLSARPSFRRHCELSILAHQPVQQAGLALKERDIGTSLLATRCASLLGIVKAVHHQSMCHATEMYLSSSTDHSRETERCSAIVSEVIQCIGGERKPLPAASASRLASALPTLRKGRGLLSSSRRTAFGELLKNLSMFIDD
jgi:hypothetical protein